MHYEENIQILRKKYPHLYEIINKISPTNLNIHQTKKGLPTISIKSKKKEIFLHSRYDPLKEVQRQVSSQNLNCGEVVILFGLGLGYFIPEIIKYIFPKGKLIIIEPNYQIFKMALNLFDFKNYLSHPDIHFIVSDQLKFISTHLKILLKEESLRNIKIIIHQPTLENIPSSLSNIEEILRNIILARKSTQFFSPLLKNNLRQNIKYVIESIGIKELFNKYLNLPILVVSAGPSLDYQINALKKIQDHVLIISVGTGLKPLLNNNISPDFIVITDSQEAVFNQFSGFLNIEVPLIFIPTAYHRIINDYQGPKIVALIKEEFSTEELKDLCLEKGEIETGGSVATASLDIAIRIGGNPIIFIGQDLSFPSLKFHAQNTYQTEEDLNRLGKFNTLEMIYRERLMKGELIEIPDVKEEPIITHRNLLIYLRWIENRIRREKEKIFINTSKIGAKIRGTINLELEEVYKKFCSSKIKKDISFKPSQISKEKYNRWEKALLKLME